MEEHTNERKKKLYNKASQLHIELLKRSFDEYINFWFPKILNLDPKYGSEKLFLDGFDYSDCYEKNDKKLVDTTPKELIDISPIRWIEDDEKIDDIPTIPLLGGNKKWSKRRKMNQNVNFKQTYNEPPSISSTSKS